MSKGYLDLLGGRAGRGRRGREKHRPDPGRVGVADRVDALRQRPGAVPAADQRLAPPLEWLNIPAGGIALDVGSGPGNVTASLARAAGPEGLALGVDISEPMLARAVRNEAGPQVGFIKADAQRLPLRDNTVDAIISTAVLQLVPNPAAALGEMARVLRPGGRLAVMVPTVGPAARLFQKLPNIGAHVFDDDEIGDILEDHGFVSVRVKNFGTLQWVRGKNG